MKKILLASITIGTVLFVLFAASNSSAITGMFYKSNTVTLSAGEQYENNMTIRKYYNMTVRFRKGNSTSDLTFSNNQSYVVLKDSNGVELLRIDEIKNGKMYLVMDRLDLEKVATVSAYSLGDYEDVIDQPANFSYTGTKAYLTVTVTIGYKPSQLSGFVLDELTQEPLDNIEIALFSKDADPALTEPLYRTATESGRYSFNFSLQDTEYFDVYVKDYETG